MYSMLSRLPHVLGTNTLMLDPFAFSPMYWLSHQSVFRMGSLDLTKSLTISCVKYFDMPSAIMYDALVRLSLKFAAILLSGNIALNKSPIAQSRFP